MNDNVIVLTKLNGYILFKYIEKGKTVEYQIFTPDDIDAIGSIYVCEIKDIVRNIDASFINYGDGRTGFLKTTKYKCGTLLPLMLKRKGTGDKAPLFTDELALAGIYTVVTNKDKNFGISKRLTPEEKSSLKEQYSSFFSDLEYGITLRTNSVAAGLKEVISEADELAGLLDDIISNGNKRTVGTLLYGTDNEWAKYCYKTDILSLDKIITDVPEIHDILKNNIIERLRTINPDIKCELYEDELLPLDKLYSINTGIREALNKKVWLRSGGFLYIETTEALTAIDVNSGKNTSEKNKEDAIYECNLEATDEICRQIRLRGLGGIIIIDYINMNKQDHIRNVVNRLKQCILRDPVKTEYHDMTALSLVELTRMKIREPLRVQFEHATDQKSGSVGSDMYGQDTEKNNG